MLESVILTKANVVQNVFKSISCPENLRAHLNGNDWDYDFRTKRRLQLKKEIIHHWLYFLRFEKSMSSKRESEILKFLNEEFAARVYQNTSKDSVDIYNSIVND